jgi:hypothetical protein
MLYRVIVVVVHFRVFAEEVGSNFFVGVLPKQYPGI